MGNRDGTQLQASFLSHVQWVSESSHLWAMLDAVIDRIWKAGEYCATSCPILCTCPFGKRNSDSPTYLPTYSRIHSVSMLLNSTTSASCLFMIVMIAALMPSCDSFRNVEQTPRRFVLGPFLAMCFQLC